MKQEEITKQADKYATSELIDTSNRSLPTRRKLLDYDNYDLSEAFKAGANWRINSIWHTKGEIPDNKKAYYLIESNTGSFDVCFLINDYFQGDSSKYELNEIKYWAYINDLKYEKT